MLLGLLGFVIFIVSFVATTGITVWFVVKLPAMQVNSRKLLRLLNSPSIQPESNLRDAWNFAPPPASPGYGGTRAKSQKPEIW